MCIVDGEPIYSAVSVKGVQKDANNIFHEITLWGSRVFHERIQPLELSTLDQPQNHLRIGQHKIDQTLGIPTSKG